MLEKADDAWKLLNGIICAYKPAETSTQYVSFKLQLNILRDLNNLKTRPVKKYLDIDRSGTEMSIKLRSSYADHELCSGPRYQNHHVQIIAPKNLGILTSGVCIMCINGGRLLTKTLRSLNFTKCYQLKGILGQATKNYYIDDKVIARAKFDHIKKYRLENILISYQSAAQRRLFEEYGLPLKSQEAYDFSVKGLYRPNFKGSPIIYSLKILHFEPPDFTIEVQCIHETELFLRNLIHNLGVNLKCYATCAGIRCIRIGCFHVEHALAKNQWSLKNILDNVNLCWKVLEKNYPDKIRFSHTVNAIKNSLNNLQN